MSTTTDSSVRPAAATPTEHAQAVREGFSSGITRPLEWRREQLRALDRLLSENTDAIEKALAQDLGKPSLEGYMTEIKSVQGEIDLYLKHVAKWTAPRKVSVPLTLRPAKASIVREPLGAVLVISP